MEKQTATRLVHYYDVQRHRIACGAPAAEDHSTKHPRGVTCGKCLALLRERAEGARTSASAAASSGTGV